MTITECGRRYAFGNFEFDAATGELSTADGSIKLRPQLALALQMLLARQPDVVSRQELRLALWPDERIVLFEASIAVVVRELRRALHDSSRAPRFIETIPRRGYRFLAPPTELGRAGVPVASPGGSHATRRDAAGGLTRVRGLVVALGLLQLSSSGHVGAGDAALAVPRRPVSVAVLPFEDLTGQHERLALADSLPRELVGRLGPAVPDRLRVVDRIDRSSPAFSRQANGGIGFVLQGSVRSEGDSVLVTARLLGGDGAYVWGEEYRRDAGAAALAELEIAARIAESVMSSVLPAQSGKALPGTVNAAAAAAYRRGVQAFSKVTREGTIAAVTAFAEASAADSGFAAAHARLAAALIGWPGPTVTPERVERARRAARRAIELDPVNADAYRVLGEISLYFDRDWQLARRMLERSVELSPADAAGHKSLAVWLSARGRHSDALRELLWPAHSIRLRWSSASIPC